MKTLVVCTFFFTQKGCAVYARVYAYRFVLSSFITPYNSCVCDLKLKYVSAYD